MSEYDQPHIEPIFVDPEPDPYQEAHAAGDEPAYALAAVLFILLVVLLVIFAVAALGPHA